MTLYHLLDTKTGDVLLNTPASNNFTATANPTAANDITQGYTPGSIWVNATNETTWTAITTASGAAVWQQTSGLPLQGAPAAKTVSSTLAAADLLAGIITVLQGAAAASNQQLPLATALDTALPQSGVNSSFDFSVINLSSVSAEIANITTNTGWTLVGSMAIAPIAAGAASAVRFRALKTAAGAWTLYRMG